MRLVSALYQKTNYTASISYLTNIFIREYDISKANINVLYSKGILDEKTYRFLHDAPRMTRQVYVGKLEKDKEILHVLQDGIREARQNLFEANQIEDHEVLAIKNDAIYIINRPLKVTKFGLIDFKNKNIYTTYLGLDYLEIYYYYNAVEKKEIIDVKGINDDTLVLHKDFFLDFLKDTLFTLQMNGPEYALDLVRNFYRSYITLQLPVGYYRKFDATSMFHYGFLTANGTGFSTKAVRESDKDKLDITYNISVIMQVQKILLDIYYLKHR